MDSADFDALEEKARANMPPGSFAFLAAGADDETTAVENVTAWRGLRLRPHVLNDISRPDTRVQILGTDMPTPLIVAPMGRHRLFHAEGERASARGAAQAGMIYTLASFSNVLLEEVAQERGPAPQWFQLYLWPNRGEVEALIDRLAAAGYGALILTVDSPVYGWSPRAARIPYVPSPDVRNINMPGSPVARTAYDPSYLGKVHALATWDDLAWLVRRAPMPVIVKGVLRGDDARRCIDTGAKAVIVSNHGGRHLDTTVTTAAALPDVIAAVRGSGEVYVDGGIRRGADIVKALALGARAVLIGRPVLWGLGCNGADGVRDVLHHLRTEFARAMQQCGAASLSEIKSDLVA